MTVSTSADRVTDLLLPFATFETGAGIPGGPFPKKAGAAGAEDALDAAAETLVVWFDFCL